MACVAEAEARRILTDELAPLAAEVGRLREALRYILQPTMGFPGGVDPEQWVRDGNCTPDNARLALATCIYIAAAALARDGET